MKRINVENRKVLIERKDQTIGVQGESNVEKIAFIFPTVVNGNIDLSEAICTLTWTNSLGTNIITPEREVKSNRTIIIWTLTSYETGASGALHFEISFTKEIDGELTYVYKTEPNHFLISRELPKGDPPPSPPDLWNELIASAGYAKERGDYAHEEGVFAQSQGAYASEQGDYAKTQGDLVSGVVGGLQGDIDALKASQIEFNAHADNSTIHVTSSDRNNWNNKADLVEGKVPASQLPSYVDDVLIFDTNGDFPSTGESGKIYVTRDTNLTYRWNGTGYTEISASLALGETSATAYRGDRGKVAYDHSQLDWGNPHNTTFAQIGEKPDTLYGYGITDAVGDVRFQTLEDSVRDHEQDWSRHVEWGDKELWNNKLDYEEAHNIVETHNMDMSAHDLAIGDKVDEHNNDPDAHRDTIEGKIGEALHDHESDGGAHEDIRANVDSVYWQIEEHEHSSSIHVDSNEKDDWNSKASRYELTDAIDAHNQNSYAHDGLFEQKVDVVSGMGLSENNYTNAEKDKLARLESSHFRGQFTSLAALEAIVGELGDYAYVDKGVGLDVVKYIWDTTDGHWVEQRGESADLTPAQVRQLYLDNPGTSEFTNVYQNKLDGIEAGAQVNVPETDPTVPAWAKTPSKPSYAFSEIGGKPTTLSGYGITDAVGEAPDDGKAYNRKGKQWEEALVSAGGTVVTVGGVGQSSVAFTSDPQTQINNRVEKEAGKGLSTNDYDNTEKAANTANTAERHSHSNKAILDATTASFLTAEKSKLAGIEAGAQVNPTPVNNLTSTSTVLPLAANQGRVLNVNKAESVLTGELDSLSITASSGVKRVYGKNVSGTLSGSAELHLTNCTGSVTISGTSAKLYVVNCPTLTISGNTVNVQFEKPFREVRIENTTGSNILVNMSVYSGWTMYLLSGQWSMQGVDVDGSPGTLEFYDRTWHSAWDRGTMKYGILLGYNSVNGSMQTGVFTSGSIAYKETVSPNFAFWPGTKILLIAPREV